MKPLIMSTSSGLTATARASLEALVLVELRRDEADQAVERVDGQVGVARAEEVEATSIAMAIRGPRPSIELKLRSAARLAVLVSENVVAVVDTTLSRA
jgi:23S rRNA G2445 N2-methylase RlmL